MRDGFLRHDGDLIGVLAVAVLAWRMRSGSGAVKQRHGIERTRTTPDIHLDLESEQS
jgi:hypothetical protein